MQTKRLLGDGDCATPVPSKNKHTGSESVSDYFNETHEQVRQTARKFIETHVRPHIDDWEEAGEFPREIYQLAGDAGLLGIGFPEALGDIAEGDIFMKVAVSEELIRSTRSEEHTSELQSRPHLVCRLLLEKKKKKTL